MDKAGIIASLETSGAIISASINRNGWFSVCTQEGDATRGVVTVYNDEGKAVYRVNLATGYVLSSEISQDNRSIAVLNLTDSGSRITYCELSSGNIDRNYVLPDSLIIEIRYLTSGDVLALSTDALFVVGKTGEKEDIYDFSGKRLNNYSLDSGLISLHLLDYGVGHRGRIAVFDAGRNLLGEIDINAEVISISSGDNYVAILKSDGITIYDEALEEMMLFDDFSSAAGAAKVLALGNSSVLTASDHSAVVQKLTGGL